MEIGFEFKVIYSDVHLIQVRIFVWNGAFGGTADVYLGFDQLEEVAKKLQGFPNQLSDAREVMLGDFAGGGVSMKFYCVDRSGHAYVECKIQSDRDSEGRVQSATLFIPVEAAAVDSFVEELRRVG